MKPLPILGLLLALSTVSLAQEPADPASADASEETMPAARVSETEASDCTSDGDPWAPTRQGWHFYCDPAPEDKPPPAAKPPAPPLPPPQSRTHEAPELAAHRLLKKRMEEAFNIALMTPTEANVKAYLALQTLVVEKSSVFSDVWQRVVMANPDFDQVAQGRPVNAQAIEVYDREQEQRRLSTVAQLAKTHALFFFYRGDCGYCHQFAPLLARFQETFGLQVVPISLDGAALPDFPYARRDNGIAKNLGVSTVPALFLADPKAGRIIPLGVGMMSDTELLERIDIAARPVDASRAAAAAVRARMTPQP